MTSHELRLFKRALALADYFKKWAETHGTDSRHSKEFEDNTEELYALECEAEDMPTVYEMEIEEALAGLGL